MSSLRVSIILAKMHYASPGCWDILIISNLGAILNSSSKYPYTKMLVFNSIKMLSQKRHYVPKTHIQKISDTFPQMSPQKNFIFTLLMEKNINLLISNNVQKKQELKRESLKIFKILSKSVNLLEPQGFHLENGTRTCSAHITGLV